jgi:Tfp pilus assembly protein PilV
MNIERCTSIKTHSGPRCGRALVECIVAALLLSVTMLALVATTRGTLALSDDSQLITRAQSLATTRVEDNYARGCASGESGSDALPRVELLWSRSNSGAVSTAHIDATLSRSPIAFAGTTPMQFTIEAGSVCP